MIIGFAGKKQSGKTTCSEFVQQCTNIAYNQSHAAKIYNFADPLKQDICINILGLTYAQCYGSDSEKNELVDCFWNNQQLTAREVMQMVGTDMLRGMKQDVWSSATINKIMREKPVLGIIADCRFPNEVEAIKNNNGIVIKLMRNPYYSDHLSEKALDEEYYDQTSFDLIIDNNHLTIDEQNQVIKQFLKDKGILPLL